MRTAPAGSVRTAATNGVAARAWWIDLLPSERSDGAETASDGIRLRTSDLGSGDHRARRAHHRRLAPGGGGRIPPERGQGPRDRLWRWTLPPRLARRASQPRA